MLPTSEHYVGLSVVALVSLVLLSVCCTLLLRVTRKADPTSRVESGRKSVDVEGQCIVCGEYGKLCSECECCIDTCCDCAEPFGEEEEEEDAEREWDEP